MEFIIDFTQEKMFQLFAVYLDSNQNEVSNHDKVILEQVEDLGLKKWFPRKLTMKTLMTVDPSENVCGTTEFIAKVDLPWIMLKRLLQLNFNWMDFPISPGTNERTGTTTIGSLSSMYDNSDKIEGISPLDIFIIVFECCDPMLKQLLFQKLHLCKLAVPFICRKFYSSESLVYVWPLRSIITEIETETGRSKDSVLDMQTEVICFARFGRPRFSKSKLINGILSDTVTDTFYNKDSPSGKIPRRLTDGYVEMFWLPSIHQTGCRFRTTLTFLNIRGDMDNAIPENISSVISCISHILTAVCDIEYILRNKENAVEIITRFSFVVLVIADVLDPKDIATRTKLSEFIDSVSNNSKTILKVLCTHKKYQERNLVEIIADISALFNEYLEKQLHSPISLKTRISKNIKTPFYTDENDECINSKKDAKKIVKAMTNTSDPDNWVKTITPVQIMSKGISELLKQKYRNKEFSLGDTIAERIKHLRQRQLNQISDPVKLFITILIHNSKSTMFLQYFLGWLKWYFEQRNRTVLPKLLRQNHAAWDKYRKLKQDGVSSTEGVSVQEKSIKLLEKQIEMASFGVENLFREVSHIFDTLICLGKHQSLSVDLPPIEDMVSVIGNLVSNGYVFELLDGNSFYMPTKWNQLLLQEVHRLIQGKNVLALSVLGVQSSGKSTLLNTMFGSQYLASSGRSTRGINAQLIPLQRAGNSGIEMPFEYFLVIDTEGLRAPELSDRNYKRDNELSTIITGLGDITMFNIMGENTTEIRDILQITVHAFLRLKLVNEKLDIKKTCIFIHQNVNDITARDKMKTGLQLLIRNLDSVTEEAADLEGISDITAFSHIIEFDTESHVWYLPNLWQGNPPMARVNRKYSDAAVDIRQKLTTKALRDKQKSFKTLHDVLLQTEDLWKGVLAEDFVFSFRNSLEKRAYIELEREVKGEFLIAENTIDEEVFLLTRNSFSQCEDQNNLHTTRKKVIVNMDCIISSLEKKTKQNMETYFNKNNYKDITIKWKIQIFHDVMFHYKELRRKKIAEIDRCMNERELDIMINLMHKAHEEELRKASLELANELRNQEIDHNEIENRFEKIWEAFVEKSLSHDTLDRAAEPLKQIFIDCITNMLSDHAVVFQVLSRYKQLQETFDIETLSGSFSFTQIDQNDISLKSKIREAVQRIPIVNAFENSFKIAQDMLESMFENVDCKINLICKKDGEIESRDIRKFLHYVGWLLKEIHSANIEDFTLKTTFKVKAIVHISSYACSRFEAVNTIYQKSHGVKVRLYKYKCQVKDRFLAHLDERKAEDTAALIFRHTIEDFVSETVQESLSLKVKMHLKQELPLLKYNILLEILRSLLAKKSFQSFISYILSPKSYALKWLSEMAEQNLFGTQPTRYSDLASAEANKCLSDIKTCIRKSVTKFGDSISSIEEWIHYFTSVLKYKVPKECFRDVIRELDQIQNINLSNFKDCLLKELTQSEKKLTMNFQAIKKDTVRWRGDNPVEKIFKEIWGCEEQCVFCGEPCIKRSLHADNHMCLQHRPSGCKGSYETNTETIWLRSCNFDITTEIEGKCSYFKFKCNPGQTSECSLKLHPMKTYHLIVRNWDIEPTTAMDEKSKFWMWFIGRYKQELSDYFKKSTDNVPKSWREISETEALESLMRIYSSSSKTEWLQR